MKQYNTEEKYHIYKQVKGIITYTQLSRAILKSEHTIIKLFTHSHTKIVLIYYSSNN